MMMRIVAALSGAGLFCSMQRRTVRVLLGQQTLKAVRPFPTPLFFRWFTEWFRTGYYTILGGRTIRFGHVALYEHCVVFLIQTHRLDTVSVLTLFAYRHMNWIPCQFSLYLPTGTWTGYCVSSHSIYLQAHEVDTVSVLTVFTYRHMKWILCQSFI
jgi:hypothetical protein